MEEEKSFTYFAFISYSHKDAKWAKWIHKALEHYRLPAIMRKAGGNRYPKRITPVFLDTADLGCGVLEKKLPEELAVSKYLIVLCSPNSASQNADGINYIDREVSWFCNEGRVDNIIPIIIEGEPNGAFCPRLKKENILALDATKQSRNRVLNDVIAKLLGLRPDELWMRELRRRRQKRVVYGGVMILLSLLFFGLGSVYKDRYCDYVKYYSNYIDEWGVPQGIGELAKTEMERRSRYYKFTYRGYAHQGDGKKQRVLRSVSYCDASGYVVDDAPCIWVKRPPSQEFYYENGKLIRKTAINESGMEMYSLSISDEGVWSKSSNNPYDSAWVWGGIVAGYEDFLKALGLPLSAAAYLPEMRTLAAIPSFFVSERNGIGLPSRIDFLPNNQSRTAMPNGLGAYGEKYSYDEMGRLKSVRFLDKDGDLLTVTNVFAGLDVDYNGLTTTVVSIDVQGRPIPNTFGWVAKQYIYSPSGNLVEMCYRNERMNLDSGPLGVAVIRTEYDESGRFAIRHLRYSPNGSLVSDNVGWAISETKYHGGRQDVYYKKANGDEFITEDGYSHISIEQTQGKRQERYFLADNVPTCHAKSLAHQRVSMIERSANGENTKYTLSWYDAKERPLICRDVNLGSVSNVVTCLGRNGIEEVRFLPTGGGLCASVKCERTMKFGRVLKSRLTFLDADEKPTVPNPVESFDMQSLENSKRQKGLFKSANIPLHTREEVDGIEISLDAMGRIEHITKLRNGKVAEKVIGGNPQSKIMYGEEGLISRIVSEDKNGLATNNVFGIAAIDLRYDTRGLTDVLFLSAKEKPVMATVFGASRFSLEYDRYGHVTWTRCYNTNDQLVVSKVMGAAVVHNEYSPQGRPLMVEFFDENMKRMPRLGSSVYATRISYQRFDEGIIQCERFLGVDGNTPVVSPELGYHMVKTVVNMRGQLIEQSSYDVDCKTLRSGNGVARMVCRYNSMGQPEGVRHYDENNKLIMEQVDVNGNGQVPIRVLGDTYGRWELQDFDVIVSVNGVFCLGDTELAEKSMTQSNSVKKITVARCGQMFGQRYIELKESVIPVEDDGVPVRTDVHCVPLQMFVEIRKVACPEQQAINSHFSSMFSE